MAQERCGTMQLDANVTKSAEWQQYEADRKALYRQALASQGARVTGVERVIPVVVHVIQVSPVEAISDARIQSQIDVLNEDFLKMNADTTLIPLEFQGVAANCLIRFCLAKIDPNGCPTTGINRVVAPALAVHGLADEQALKSYVQWDPHMYLNMWVPVNLKDNLLGYATFPTWLPFSPENDGVVVNGFNTGRGFGTPASSYNLGRTATHEVGHWLGLYHTFEGGCSGMTAQNCLTQGDEVCDTPPTTAPMFGCPSNVPNTCQESPVDHNDQTQNYMDYTDDRCMVMFSTGQRDRMMYFLDNERAQIWSAANLMATGCDGTVSAGCQPIAAFDVNPTNVCVGATIQFTDRTFGPATSWAWTFQSGNPASSNQQNPTATWSQAGTYDVSLRVTNGIGADTLIQQAIVIIAAPRQGPVIEGFEADSTLPLEWYATDADLQGTWQVSTVTGKSGQNSVFSHHFPAGGPHTRDDLVSHVIDMTGVGGAFLTFERAYRRRSSFATDSLHVLVSVDCGNTWQKVWERWNSGLSTTGGYASSAGFVPNPTQWRSDTVDLQAFAGVPELRIMFRSIGGSSQDIYLDDINMSLITSAAGSGSEPATIWVYPHPSVDVPTIQIDLPQASLLEGTLQDLQGRVLMVWPQQRYGAGRHRLEISPMDWGNLAAGLYLLNVSSKEGSFVTKVVKTAAH